MLEDRLSSQHCRIVTKDIQRDLSEILMWNNTKKPEKQAALSQILRKLTRQEAAYLGEVYLKQTQINILRASYSKMF